MSTSESIAKLSVDLAKAQGEMKNAPVNKENPHFHSKYADLASIRDATIPALAQNALALFQFTSIAERQVVLHTRLSHSSGEWVESEYPIALEKPQQMGSAMTYARRYCWSAMCGIAAEEDDDANQAQKGKAPTGRDITHGVGTMAIDPSKGTFDLINPWGEVENTFNDAFQFMASLTGRVESTGGWWPNNSETVKQIGIRAKDAANEKLRKVAHSTMKFGIDAWRQCPENPINKRAEDPEVPQDELDELLEKPTPGSGDGKPEDPQVF